ncbi:MAG: SusC/RagA family TonB-linked outer membrane protein [Rhodothermales bacterium]
MNAMHFLDLEASEKQSHGSLGIIILLILLTGFTFPTQDVNAQGTISGAVTDALTGDPLPGATVTVVGSQVGSTTDINGRYQITGVPAGTHLVRARFVGFVPLDRENVVITNGGTATVDFGLSESAIDLGEVTVVGYGTLRSEDVTGSVGVIDAENIAGQPLTSVDQALQGQVAGVSVRTSSGVPGGGPDIQVRGTGNVGAGGQPLYVIDGFALPQPSQRQSNVRNPLADIPTEDIASITILKDASATAIYGSRASNGVVIVTTKSGTAGPLQLNISAYSGVNSPLEQMTITPTNAQEFATFQNLLWQGRVDAGTATEIPIQYQNPNQYGEGTNWWDQIYRNAQQFNLQASASGGSATMRSYFSAGYTREEGQVLETDYNRVSLRANLEANLSDKITAGLRLAPTFSIRNLGYEGGGGRGGNGSPGGGPWMMCPLSPVYLEDGSFNPQIGHPSEPGGGCPGVWNWPNPIQWFEQDVDKQQSLRALTTAYVNYEFLPGLSVRQSFNVDYSSSEREQFRPSTIGTRNIPAPSVPSGSFASSSYLNWLSETTLNYSANVGPGRLDAIGGFTAQEENLLSTNISGLFPDDQIQTLNVAFNLNGNSNENAWSLLSGLARVNYNIKDRYVLTGTIRRDGSSRFGANTRWGTFPSGAVAWNLHNESFMQGSRSKIPELRARLSYGETGNNQINNYASLGTVTALDYVLGGSSAAGRILNTLGNADLAWEKTQEVNFGIDAALYNYQVRLSLELYQRNTTQLLLNRELPELSGFASVVQNQGEVRNQGVEFSMSTVNVSTPKFSWTTDFNVSLNRNEVINLPDGNDIFYRGAGPTAFVNREGLPLATFVGYVIDGLYDNQGEIDSSPSYAGAVPGSFIIRDLNGDGVITERALDPIGDFAVLGDAYPDFTFGMTQTVKIGNVDIRALVTGSFGGDNLRAEFFRTARNIDGLFIVDADYVKNVWRSSAEPGDGITPTMNGGAFGRQQYRDNNHSLVLSDASYIWLRNLMVRYNFKRGPLAGSNFYLSGDNLAILTPYDGNPDVTDDQNGSRAPGLDFGNYPIPRSFTFGVELNLR